MKIILSLLILLILTTFLTLIRYAPKEKFKISNTGSRGGYGGRVYSPNSTFNFSNKGYSSYPKNQSYPRYNSYSYPYSPYSYPYSPPYSPYSYPYSPPYSPYSYPYSPYSPYSPCQMYNTCDRDNGLMIIYSNETPKPS